MQGFIEHVLNDLDIPYIPKHKYIHTHNPFQEDLKKSTSIYYDGMMKIWNG